MFIEIVRSVISDDSNRRIIIADDEPEKKKGKPAATAKPRAPRLKSIEEIACPKCGEGHLLKGRTAYGCSRYKEGCDLRLPFADYPETLTPAKLRTALKKL
ncbi:MAG: DNA topoisomerase III, partial [Muribaculaceae bacterium]|nr:DNA topoisomerase III [Muribaculaceae bacterium]